MVDRIRYDQCRALIVSMLQGRYDVKIVEVDGDSPAVRFDFNTGLVAVHGALWSNLSFDIEAVHMEKGPIVAESVLVSDQAELQQLLSAALDRIDQA